MKTRLSSADVDKIDAETVVLPFFSDEKPLRGASGLIDWRMNGSLSRLLLSGRVNGERGETTLVLPNRRIRAGKILLIGLGESGLCSEDLIRECADSLMGQLVKIGVKRFIFAVPPRRAALLPPAQVAGAAIQGMAESVERTGIRDDIYVTLAVEKGELDETRATLDRLRRSPEAD